MKSFDVQSIEIQAGFHRAFTYIADPKTLPEWTHAFKEVSDGTAVMATPQGSVPIRLAVNSSAHHGTIDWMMDFPDTRLHSPDSSRPERTDAFTLSP